MQNERILDVFPAADENHRLVIAVAEISEGESRYVLRQETFSSDVGWFVQSRISIEPEQMAGLKAALTCGRTRKLETRRSGEVAQAASILSFKAAAAG